MIVSTSRESIQSYVTVYAWSNGKFEAVDIAEYTNNTYAILHNKGESWYIEGGREGKERVSYR